MRKTEIARAKDNELIVDYVRSYGLYLRNMNLGLGEKRLANHCADLEKELVKRGILTKENIDALNK